MILNIGPLEFILILLVAIIVLGPERMVSGARTFGRWIYKLVRSPTWRAIMTTSQELRELPNKIVRESGIEESLKEVQSVGSDLNNEISQAVKDVNDEVSMAASAVSAEVSQAVKDVNAELKQSTAEVSQAATEATVEANQIIQSGAGESQSPVEIIEDSQAPAVAEENTPPVDEVLIAQPVLVIQDASEAGAAALSNNGHTEENAPEAPAVESPAIAVVEASAAPVEPKVRKARKSTKASKVAETKPPEDEPSIQPPQSPGSRIRLE
jgi:sec-independent protein translocase protein TatB